jgi:hypothetical protein
MIDDETVITPTKLEVKNTMSCSYLTNVLAIEVTQSNETSFTCTQRKGVVRKR